MIADICATGTLPAATTTVRELAGAPGECPAAVTVQGPGGTGKTHLLGELTTAWRRAGLVVLDGVPADPTALPAEFAVVVDDAHRLSGPAAAGLAALVGAPGARIALAYRPWPRPAPLTALLPELGAERRTVVLGHADRAVVRGWAREQLGEAATPDLVDTVLGHTGGLPALVHPVLRALARRGIPRGGAAGSAVPEEVADRVSAQLATVDEETRALLHAVAAGAPLEDEVLGGVLDVLPGHAAELVTAARASGLLLPSGAVVPLVAQLLLGATPPDVTRRTRRRLLGLLVERGEEPLDLARRLAAERVRDPLAARLLERRGEAALADDPALAGELLGAAALSGAPVAGLAARRAQAAALAGDLDGALQWADTALADPAAPDRARAAGVTAAVLAQRGLLGRAAALCRLAGPERAGSAALALIATGAPEEAAAVLDGARAAGGLPTMLSVSEELTAQGVLQSLRAGADAAEDIAAALSTLTRAAALLEPVGRTALLVDTPAALAALVALHSGELGVAESVLQRAVDADLGGAPCRPRHRLLLAWIAMLAGRMTRAREYMAMAQDSARSGPAQDSARSGPAQASARSGPAQDSARSGPAQEGGGQLEPRDDVFLRALEVGLARRSSDVPALVRAWVRAREAVVRHPVDLFTLLPLGELVVAAARLRDGDRLRPHLAEAQALLTRLGEPQLWATSLHWSGAQAAILADDPDGLRPHAAALVAAARTSPYAATLARAGRSWMRVLTGDVDAASVVTAAEELTAVGLGWDGSRLAGQAAARAVDQKARAVLLGCARALADSTGCESAPSLSAPRQSGDAAPGPAPASAPAASGVLSEREREVARLVVEGQTYREIGSRLYISAKTVEHHVSRMRQRLGASNRSDLLARLRAELADGA
ncbi:helix-turn-helix transcriptional regulator [Geodermatophilus sabuli]|uniref:Regulatory protein, luxR family n=1 Tax=Geodermatophilus sabuli TaxID=1564158 RepID=A0A285EEC7_9ACTN|nr:helix-turn-helix transcriptional regulator [Geodermatophilus sabuli]MBB3086326.1 DNA-binding CsgD family transcriptional regulator [Geodermatophilus sabuli]SNX97459.1 regulatory protein, luxR family [Geodermatophilus sabuli]